jgi:hypothetical protein
VNGPSITADGSRVAVAWFTAAADRPTVKVAFSHDGGESFGAPVVVDGDRPLGRVDAVLLDGGAALVSWLAHGEAGVAALRVRRFAPDGALGDAATVAVSTSARSSGFPRMVRAGRRVVVAWRDAADPPRVRTAIMDTTSED